MTLNLAVLVSGRGGNLAAIARAIDAHTCAARIVTVISDRASAPALAFAAERSIPTAIVSLHDHADRSAWDLALTERLASATPDLVILAGFMRLVGPALLQRYPRRVLNVHPALLPAFPGTTGPAQALAAGVAVSGCTVHVVDAGVDTGPIIAQGVVRVLPDDTVDTLHQRIQRVEHQLFPQVIDAIARGKITLDPMVRVHDAFDDGRVLCAPLLRDGTS